MWLAVACFLAVLVFAAVATLAIRRCRRPGKMRRFAAGVIAAASGVLAIAALFLCGWFVWFSHRSRPAPERRDLRPGVTYVRDVRRSPRPMIIHVVMIDLTRPGVRCVVTAAEPTGGRQLRARTTTRFLADFHAQIAINANYFRPFRSAAPWDFYPHEGDGVEAVGLAAANGTACSPKPWHGGTLYVTREGRPTFTPPAANDLFAAVSGNGFVLRDGRPADRFPDAPDVRNGLDARAAVGMDRNERNMVLMVIDGKQPNYSEGATQQELADLLRVYGADTAVRLDEGGSATLAAEAPDGRPVLLSTPIHTRIPGRQRPVANHLGIVVPHSGQTPETLPVKS
jgi:Phosphodiester glycosidase